MYDYTVRVIEDGATVSTLTPTPDDLITVYEAPATLTQVVVEGPQGIPGAGVILIEASETEPPDGTPEGSIIFRKLS